MNTDNKKMCCPITGAYIPRLVLCVIAGFAFIFGFNFVVHNNILMERYEQTSHLWRTMEDMQTHFGFMLFTQFITAFTTAVLYTKCHKGKGICGGVCFGLFIGLLLGVLASAPYAWTPIPEDLAQAWFVAGLVEGLGLGIIYSILYKSPCDNMTSCDTENKDNKKTGCCG